jgi:hypothetical protein
MRVCEQILCIGVELSRGFYVRWSVACKWGFKEGKGIEA